MNDFASTSNNGNVHADYDPTPLQAALKKKRESLRDTMAEKSGVKKDEDMEVDSRKSSG